MANRACLSQKKRLNPSCHKNCPIEQRSTKTEVWKMRMNAINVPSLPTLHWERPERDLILKRTLWSTKTRVQIAAVNQRRVIIVQLCLPNSQNDFQSLWENSLKKHFLCLSFSEPLIINLKRELDAVITCPLGMVLNFCWQPAFRKPDSSRSWLFYISKVNKSLLSSLPWFFTINMRISII